MGPFDDDSGGLAAVLPGAKSQLTPAPAVPSVAVPPVPAKSPVATPVVPAASGLASLYSKGIDDSVNRWIANPGPAPQPSSFSLWSALVAGGKAPAAGALDSAAGTADLLSLFAGPAAATFGAMDTSGAVDQAGVEAARQKMLKGDTFDPAAGDALRRKADTFMPDPTSSSVADQTIAGLTRGVTKAAVDVTTMGLVPGAVAFGVDEGNNTGQRARMDGVDTATAAKLGLVSAAANTAGALIPMGGSTVLKTIGLAAAAGPGTFMAQEALSRNILADAGYKDLASLHNPLDPLGLGLATAIPFTFGALHLRAQMKAAANAPTTPATLADVVQTMESNGKRYGPDGQLLTSPKGAQGEMQVMSATATDPGFGVAPARDNSPAELARVGRDYLGAMEQRYGDDSKAMAAYNAGPGAVDKAVAAHGADWLGHMPEETQNYVAKGTKLMGDHTMAHASSDPDIIDAARVKVTNAALHENLPDFPQAHSEVMSASDEIAAGRFPEVQAAPEEFPIQPRITGEDLIGKSFDELDAMHTAARDHNKTIDLEGIRRFFGDQQATEAEGWNTRTREAWLMKNETAESSDWMQDRYINDDIIKEHRGAVNDFDSESPESLGASIAVRARNIDEPRFFTTPEGHTVRNALQFAKEQGWDLDKVLGSMRGRAAEWAGNDAPELFQRMFQQPAAKLRALEPAPRRVPEAPSEGTNALPRPDAVTAEPAPKVAAEEPKATAGKPEPPSAISQRAAAIAETDPSLKVKLPGSDETVTVGEALERAQAAAKEEADGAKLVDAAFKCFLSFGA